MADFSKPILAAATATLTPLGLVRIPRPPLFVDDQGWFAIVVQARSHRSKPAAMLDVAVDFHWYVRDHFAYSLGGRVVDPAAGHGDFELGGTPAQVKVKVRALMEHAERQVLAYREQLKGLDSARTAILTALEPSDPWRLYDAALIEGLAGDGPAAAARFAALRAIRHEAPWFTALKDKTLELEPLLSRPAELAGVLGRVIAEARAAKKLSARGELSAPWEH